MDEYTRGQSGLDRLLVFVVAVIVLAAVGPTILGVAGIDVRPATDQSPSPDTQTTPTPTVQPASLQVLSVSGNTSAADSQSLGVVRVTVTKVGSDAAIDLSELSATWVGERSLYLVANGRQTATTDGVFGLTVRHTSNATGLILAETGDRATLTFDLGSDDVDGLDEFGTELAEGDTVEILLSTADGRTTTVTVHVPDSLAGRTVVGL